MSKVYFLPWEKIEEFPAWVQGTGLAATVKERDFVALKIHFGERGNKGYIQPRLVRPVAELLKQAKANPFVTDASTIYVGTRADAVHLRKTVWLTVEHIERRRSEPLHDQLRPHRADI